MKSHLLAGTALAVLAALLFVLTAAVPVPLAAQKGTAAPPTDGIPFAVLTPHAMWLGGYLGSLNASDRANAIAMTETESVASATAFLHYASAPSYVTPSTLETDVHLFLDTNWGQVGIAFLVGCGAGAIAGGVPGCLIGGTVTGLVDYFAQQTAAAQASSAELTVDTAVISDYLNAMNATLASFRTALASNNATLNFLENQAAAVSVNQLGYAVFDPILDAAQAGIPGELNSVEQAFYAQFAGFANVVAQWGIANYGPNGRFAAASDAMCLDEPNAAEALCAGHVGQSTNYRGSYAMGVGVSGAGPNTDLNQSYYIPQGANVSASCQNGYTATLSKLANNYGNGSYSISPPAAGGSVYFNGPTGVYKWVSTNPAYCSLFGTDLMFMPLGLGATGHETLFVTNCTSPCSTNRLDQSSTGFGWLPQAGVYYISCTPGCSQLPVFQYAASVPNWQLYTDNLEVTATTAAQAYWSFLKSQGFNGTNKIPANCVIPYPSNSLPPSISNVLGNLTAQEATALYTAWMNGLATFFNSPINGTNFCSGHAIFRGPALLPAPNSIVVTGYVYLAEPPALKQKEKFAFGSPNVTRLETWAVNGTATGGKNNTTVPMIIYPTVRTITVPLGVVYSVPSNDPVAVYAPVGNFSHALPTYYLLHGNGSSVWGNGSLVHTDAGNTTPGDALYITSCTQNGVPITNCTLTVSTLQGYLANITCPQGPNGCGPQAPPPSGGFSWGGLINGLASFICTITFGLVCGSAANLVAQVLADLLIIGIVLIAVVLVYEGVTRTGSSRRREPLSE